MRNQAEAEAADLVVEVVLAEEADQAAVEHPAAALVPAEARRVVLRQEAVQQRRELRPLA